MVGWSIDSTQSAALVTSALDMAIRNRDAQPGVVIHPDHGTRYTSWAFTDRARVSGLVPSMLASDAAGVLPQVIRAFTRAAGVANIRAHRPDTRHFED